MTATSSAPPARYPFGEGRVATRVHPVAALSTAASTWFLVVAGNHPAVSTVIIGASWVVGVLVTRSALVPLGTLGLSIPAGLSMLLIHAPYGEHQIAPLITSDGLAVAGALTLRFAALMACVFAAATVIHVPDLAKVCQATPLGHRVGYVVAAALLLVPHGARTVAQVRDANALRGNKLTIKTVIPLYIVPVIMRLITDGAERGEALAATGFDQPGTRTVMRPVMMSRGEKAVAIVAPMVAVGVAVAIWL